MGQRRSVSDESTLRRETLAVATALGFQVRMRTRTMEGGYVCASPATVAGRLQTWAGAGYTRVEARFVPTRGRMRAHVVLWPVAE